MEYFVVECYCTCIWHHRDSKIFFHPAKFDNLKDEKISDFKTVSVSQRKNLLDYSPWGLSPPVGDEPPGPVVGADVEGLALGSGVSVVAALHQTIAGEASVGDLSIDGIVLAWDPGDVDLVIVHI